MHPLSLLSLPHVAVAVFVISLQTLLLLLAPSLIINTLGLIIQTSGDNVSYILV